MAYIRTGTYDHDAIAEQCHDDRHVRGCPCQAGGDVELHRDRVPRWTPQDEANLARRVKRLATL